MKLTRRHFLGLLGATAAGTGLLEGVAGRVRAVTAPRDNWRDRTETHVPSICRLCPGGCGLNVRVIGGLPVKIKGNPLYPVNHAGLCPRGQAALQSLYHPDRLVSPMRRVGGKGSDAWEAIAWDEALEQLTSALAHLREDGTPEALTVLTDGRRGIIDRLWARYARAYGTPNHIRLQTRKPETVQPVAALMHGETRPITFDLLETSFVLSFGCNWLESWNSPVYQMRAYGRIRQGHDGRRGEIIHVEPHLSQSAAKADLWVSIKPGAEGVFAMGLAHLIVRERIYDEEFVANHTFGFDGWVGSDGREHAGLKRLVLEEYSPLRVSEITGVDPEVIITVARKLASAKSAVVLGDNRSLLDEHDLFTQMAIHSLNALVGNIGAAGGVLPGNTPVPVSPWPGTNPDKTAEDGLAHKRIDGAGAGSHFLDTDVPHALAAAVLDSEPSPVKVLIVHGANPLHGRADKDQFRKAFEKIPLVVSLGGFPDEVSQCADLILPEHHFLEGWQDDEITHLPGFTLFGVGQPALRPLYDTRHPGEIILAVAKAAGSAVASAFPWKSYEDLLRETAKGLFEAPRGYVASVETDELFREILRRQGYRAPEYDGFESFWSALTASGAWWDPTEEIHSVRSKFRTPSGKFEFYSQILEARWRKDAVNGNGGGTPTDDELFFPRFLLSQAREEAVDHEFPFVLQTYELLSIGDGSGASLPWLQENISTQVKESWDSWVEIHPGAAEKLGIRDGDWVVVHSSRTQLRTRARHNKAIRPEVLAMPVGQGHASSGRWAKDRGVDPSDLLMPGASSGGNLEFRVKTRVAIQVA